MAKQFNLDQQFEDFLKRIDLDPAALSPNELAERKKCFFGGLGAMLVLMTNDVAALPEPAAVHRIKIFQENIMKFWQTATTKFKATEGIDESPGGKVVNFRSN